MSARWRELESGHARLEGKVVDGNATVKVGQDRTTSFIDSQK
jgi:hypothetical protein